MKVKVLKNSASYRDLIVWQKAMDLSELVYEATANMPTEEKYGLISQMRRSSVSLPSNIAEGHGRNTDNNFLNFLGVAQGSLKELETQLILCGRLGFIEPGTLGELMSRSEELGRMIYGLMNSVRKR